MKHLLASLYITGALLSIWHVNEAAWLLWEWYSGKPEYIVFYHYPAGAPEARSCFLYDNRIQTWKFYDCAKLQAK